MIVTLVRRIILKFRDDYLDQPDRSFACTVRALFSPIKMEKARTCTTVDCTKYTVCNAFALTAATHPNLFFLILIARRQIFVNRTDAYSEYYYIYEIDC